ncbi:MAG: NlpC/P60 family protein [Pseudomonadota bacterium]
MPAPTLVGLYFSKGKQNMTMLVNHINMMEVTLPVINMYPQPKNDYPLSNQLLLGERVQIIEQIENKHGCFYKAQAEQDGYQGFVKQKGLATAHKNQAEWFVDVQTTLLFEHSNIKSRHIATLGFASQIQQGRVENDLMETPLGWVCIKHLRSKNKFANNPAQIAKKMLHMPYLWGGRSHQGIDCSALIQHALAACKIKAPRDSAMQQQADIGTQINFEHIDQLKDNDLLFWPGHVAIIADHQILHANQGSMQTSFEDLQTGLLRIGKACKSNQPIICRLNI